MRGVRWARCPLSASLTHTPSPRFACVDLESPSTRLEVSEGRARGAAAAAAAARPEPSTERCWDDARGCALLLAVGETSRMLVADLLFGGRLEGSVRHHGARRSVGRTAGALGLWTLWPGWPCCCCCVRGVVATRSTRRGGGCVATRNRENTKGRRVVLAHRGLRVVVGGGGRIME